MATVTPGRGDLVVINFNPQAGHEQAGRRNAIVLSPEEFNAVTGFMVVCPITNQKKAYPYEVELPEEGFSLGDDGFPITGVVLSDQVKSIDWKAQNLKVLKKYDVADEQIDELDELVEDCLAKIELEIALIHCKSIKKSN